MKGHRLIVATILRLGLLASVLVLPMTAQAGFVSSSFNTKPQPTPTPAPTPQPAELRDIPGSFLIFPKFDTAAGAATQIRITDVSDPALGGPTLLEVDVICPPTPPVDDGICQVNDSHERLTFHGTLILDLATEFPGLPCKQGFFTAFATDAFGNAISHNNLTGSYRITGGVAVDAKACTADPDCLSPETCLCTTGNPPCMPALSGKCRDAADTQEGNAIAAQSVRSPGAVLGANDLNTGELLLHFGSPTSTADYVALPTTLYSDFQATDPTLVPPRKLSLILLTPSIRANVPNPAVTADLHFWNQFEDEHSSALTFTCWQEFPLGDLTNNTGGFLAANLGSPYGSVRIKALQTPCLFPIGDCARVKKGAPRVYSPAILGVVREDGPGPSHRTMFHSGLRSTDYAP